MIFGLKKCLMVFATLGLVACGQAANNKPDSKPSAEATPAQNGQTAVLPVVASFSILGDMVKAIGGERVQVDNLVGINQDSHVYQPTPQDVQKIGRAKVFVVNGLGFEGWLVRLEKNAGFNGVKVVATDGVPPLAATEEEHEHEHEHGDEHKKDEHKHDEAHHDEHDHGDFDPHVWMDPNLVAAHYVPNIVKGLSQADPAGASYYQQRGQQYVAQLNQLSIQMHQILDRTPRDQRKVVVSHRAFEYFGKAFGVDFYSVQGVSTESQPSAKQVAELINQIRTQKIRALFAENISDPKMIEQISNETGVRVGNKLFTGALSDESGYAPTYLRMMQYNADQIAAAVR